MESLPRHDAIEPRWPVALAIVATMLLLMVLPGRVRLFPPFMPWILGTSVLVPMIAVSFGGAAPGWLRAERLVALLFFAIVGVGTVANLGNLIGEMVHPSAAIGGMSLLTSSIAVWVTNVLAFSLLYWQLDRGGPGLRHAAARPDWVFQQDGVPQMTGPDWRPAFVDYLFLAYTTATAFSPTAALPLTPRAMVLMMTESAISLVTIVVVAARSINILGS